jgi:hypothetical protein
MQGNAERRQNARLPHSSRLKVKDVAKGSFLKGMLINFSQNGLFFESNSSFDPGTEVFIAIEDSPFDAPAAGQDFYLAVIRHCRELDEASYFLYGCGAELVTSYGTAIFSGTDGN